MIRNYLKMAWRNLWKNKVFSTINIIGLAVGFSICLLIMLFVIDETSYDSYNENADRIFRLEADIYFNDTQANFATSPDPLGPTLLEESPLVEQMTGLSFQRNVLIKQDSKNLQDHNLAFVDSTFFKVFTIPFLRGNPESALRDPLSIVIDETTAKKYFNTIEVIGKTLYVDNTTTCNITGVMKDFPRQSHFHFSFLRPKGRNNIWLSNNTYNYILTRKDVSKEQLQEQVDAIADKYIGMQLQAELNTTLTDLKRDGNHISYVVRPLTEIHLHAANQYEIEANSDAKYVYIFSAIALLILLIACVNFMNLSTAQSANRAKEVGIRKVAGSLKSNLITQFLTESIMVSFISLLLSMGLAMLFLPMFNQLANKEMSVATFFSTWLFPVTLGLVIIVGLIAGSYPALYLSSFKPVLVLKGKIASGFKNNWLRSGLVVFQFTISVILILGTLVIYKQLDYIQNKKLGYERDQTIVVHDIYNLNDKRDPFKNEVLKMSNVENMTIGDLPTEKNFDNEGWFKDTNFDVSKAAVVNNFYVDENYIPTLGMEIKIGRNFSNEFPTDSKAIILNETAVKMLGIKDPLGDILYRSGTDENGATIPDARHIIGVVKDFNFNSLRRSIEPVIIVKADNYNTMAIRTDQNSMASVISSVQTEWNRMVPEQPFSYTIMDDDFNRAYSSEQQTGKLFVIFAIFAIFIGCLGLFGLVTYAAEQRTKEIGIRKVLGAKVIGIVTMLSKDYAKLVLVATLVAFPLAGWIMTKWLQGFVYRTSLSWWMFLIAGGTVGFIAILTIGIQSFKAATNNPTKSLRTE